MRRATPLAFGLLAGLSAGCRPGSPRREDATGHSLTPKGTVSQPAAGPSAGRPITGGRLRVVNGYQVLELSGSPEEMGRAHGRLLARDIRRVVADVLRPEAGSASWERILAGTKVMERHQPERFRREMRALAEAAAVDYLRIVALQLFGDAEIAGAMPDDLPSPVDDLLESEGASTTSDMPGHSGDTLQPVPRQFAVADTSARRGIPIVCARGVSPEYRLGFYQCTNFAIFGPATRTGECIVGRNFDYWYQDVARYASVIIHYRPEGRRAFVTLTWAGVINGWTLMNDAGICAANNLASGISSSLEGVSTCFLQRLIIESAGTVEEGIDIARRSPRAIGCAMLIAGGSPPDAVELEFDHERLFVRRAHRGWVIADNTSRVLGRTAPLGPEDTTRYSRYGTLLGLVEASYGRIDRTMNFAASPGVALESMNLHSAMLFPADLSFAVSMGEVPACRRPFRRFRMTAEGIVSAEKE